MFDLIVTSKKEPRKIYSHVVKMEFTSNNTLFITQEIDGDIIKNEVSEVVNFIAEI